MKKKNKKVKKNIRKKLLDIVLDDKKFYAWITKPIDEWKVHP
jgi:hypothetical protein